MIETHLKTLPDGAYAFAIDSKPIKPCRLYRVWLKACNDASVKAISLQPHQGIAGPPNHAGTQTEGTGRNQEAIGSWQFNHRRDIMLLNSFVAVARQKMTAQKIFKTNRL